MNKIHEILVTFTQRITAFSASVNATKNSPLKDTILGHAKILAVFTLYAVPIGAVVLFINAFMSAFLIFLGILVAIVALVVLLIWFSYRKTDSMSGAEVELLKTRLTDILRLSLRNLEGKFGVPPNESKGLKRVDAPKGKDNPVFKLLYARLPDAPEFTNDMAVGLREVLKTQVWTSARNSTVSSGLSPLEVYIKRVYVTDNLLVIEVIPLINNTARQLATRLNNELQKAQVEGHTLIDSTALVRTEAGEVLYDA